jgi:hypothetical protein
LEFKAITLNDIWDQLPDAITEPAELSPIGSTVWSVMEKLQVSGAVMHIQQPDSHAIKSVSFEQLMKAFNQYQNRKSA